MFEGQTSGSAVRDGKTTKPVWRRISSPSHRTGGRPAVFVLRSPHDQAGADTDPTNERHLDDGDEHDGVNVAKQILYDGAVFHDGFDSVHEVME